MKHVIPIRILSDGGIERMNDFLDSFRSGEGRPLSEIDSILTSDDTSRPAPKIVRIDRTQEFPRRYDLAEHLASHIPALELRDPVQEKGLWAWLALAWFEQFAPIEDGRRKIGERAKWVPDATWNKIYRHLVLGPYMLYDSNHDQPERAMALLHNPPHKPGEVVGQLASTYRVVQARSVIGVATRLYYDSKQECLKPGSGGSGWGSARRYRTVLDQLDRTYDLQSITEEQLLRLLPGEFDRFRPG